MKNLGMLVLVLIASLSVSKASAQSVSIDKYEVGRAITPADIELLKVVKGLEGKNMTTSNEVVFDQYKFVLGQKLTKEQASVLEAKITEYTRIHGIKPTKPVGIHCSGCNTVVINSSKGKAFEVCNCTR